MLNYWASYRYFPLIICVAILHINNAFPLSETLGSDKIGRKTTKRLNDGTKIVIGSEDYKRILQTVDVGVGNELDYEFGNIIGISDDEDYGFGSGSGMGGSHIEGGEIIEQSGDFGGRVSESDDEDYAFGSGRGSFVNENDKISGDYSDGLSDDEDYGSGSGSGFGNVDDEKHKINENSEDRKLINIFSDDEDFAFGSGSGSGSLPNEEQSFIGINVDYSDQNKISKSDDEDFAFGSGMGSVNEEDKINEAHDSCIDGSGGRICNSDDEDFGSGMNDKINIEDRKNVSRKSFEDHPITYLNDDDEDHIFKNNKEVGSGDNFGSGDYGFGSGDSDSEDEEIINPTNTTTINPTEVIQMLIDYLDSKGPEPKRDISYEDEDYYDYDYEIGDNFNILESSKRFSTEVPIPRIQEVDWDYEEEPGNFADYEFGSADGVYEDPNIGGIIVPDNLDEDYYSSLEDFRGDIEDSW